MKKSMGVVNTKNQRRFRRGIIKQRERRRREEQDTAEETNREKHEG